MSLVPTILKQIWSVSRESDIVQRMGSTVFSTRSLLSLATCLMCSSPLVAQERLAYVIGNGRMPDSVDAQPGKDAVAISRALLARGFDVIRREDTTPHILPLGRRAARTVALYFSGQTRVEDGQTMLMAADGTSWPLVETIQEFRNAGADQVLAFVETCAAEADAIAPISGEDLDGSFLALAMDPAEGCAVEAATPRFTDRLLSALATPDTGLEQAFEAANGAGWSLSALSETVVLWESTKDEFTLSSEDMAVLDRLAPAERTRMRALWEGAGLMEEDGTAKQAPVINVVRDDAIVLSGRVTPVDMGSIVAGSPLSSDVPSGGAVTIEQVSFKPETTATDAGGIQIFAAAPRSQVEALPTAAGLPQPSVIVGRIRDDDGSFGSIVDGGALDGTALDGSSFEARQNIRGQDAELYAQLVGSGAFDPPDGQLAVVLQTELKRMGCYTGAIDGDWGRGSQGSVDRYFAQIEEGITTRDATIELFRQIALRDDVTCPQVVQARAARSTATTQRTTTQTTTSRTTSAPKATTPAANSSSGTGTINPNSLGTGVFR